MAPEWAARLARADESLRRIREARRRCPSFRHYAQDADARDIAERNIQIAVEAVIDRATELVARKQWGRPNSAVRAVTLVTQHGVLPSACGASLRRWIRLRNVLVPEYAVIDNAKVFAALSRHVQTLCVAITRMAKALA